MKIQELKQKSKDELKKLLSDKREELRVFRFNIAGSKVKNVKQALGIKHDIARIMTILNLNI